MLRIPSFISRCIASILIPAIVSLPLCGMQSETYLHRQSYHDPLNTSHLITYDEVLAYLADIENGVLEARCNAQDLERINTWLIYLARCGVIPGDIEAESLLEIDIEDLEDEGRSFDFASCYDEDIQFILIPTYEDHKIEAFFCKSWLS